MFIKVNHNTNLRFIIQFHLISLLINFLLSFLKFDLLSLCILSIRKEGNFKKECGVGYLYLRGEELEMGGEKKIVFI